MLLTGVVMPAPVFTASVEYESARNLPAMEEVQNFVYLLHLPNLFLCVGFQDFHERGSQSGA